MSAPWIASWWTAAEYSSSGCCSFSDLMLLVGQHEGHPAYKKTGWWGAGIVIYLERGTELYTAQLMPLPLTFSCLNNVQIGFTYRLTWVVPDKGPLNGRVCVRCCCSCCCCCSCSLCFVCCMIQLRMPPSYGFCALIVCIAVVNCLLSFVVEVILLCHIVQW